jgi:uncharacterized protein YndB with AHSA1/START domain
MEYGTYERDIHVDASPEVVFEVVSTPEHMRQWWPDDARFEPVAGAPGEIVWHNTDTGEKNTVAIGIVEVVPPKRFAFRWCYTQPDRGGDSLLVTFDLEPAGPGGTLIRMKETGFREMGWEAAVLEENYRDHEGAWNHFIPRLGVYAEKLNA